MDAQRAQRRRLIRTAASLMAVVCTGKVVAEELPDKPLTIVVGFSAGGAIDTLARIVAKHLGDWLQRSVVVSNRPGAGGNIAQQVVVSATPDGATLLLGTIGSLAINPHLTTMGYDPLRELAAVTMAVSFPNVLVVSNSLGVSTLRELVDLAKKKPLDYASSGVGSASHVAGEMLNQAAGIDMRHVSYKGGNAAMVDLLAERVSAYYSTPSSALPFIEGGKVKPIAVTSLQRTRLLANVPTIAESGFPGFNATNWYAFVAPAKTPSGVLDRWNREFVNVLNSSELVQQLVKHGLFPVPGSREQLAQHIKSESALWRRIVSERKITTD